MVVLPKSDFQKAAIPVRGKAPPFADRLKRRRSIRQIVV
jgi:hypothetical protein